MADNPAMPPTLRTTTPSQSQAGRTRLSAFLRRGLLNLLLCLGIAGLFWLLTSGQADFFTGWVYSTCIGSFCWFFIDGGRLIVAAWRQRGLPDVGAAQARWPGAVWMVLCLVGGSLAGYSLGSTIADALTGHNSPSLLASQPSMAITLVAAIGSTFYFYATERLSAEAAAAESARRLAAEMQLRLLESQLEPHMLFNTLANLRALIGVDPARAQAMLDRIIDFLRATLSASRVSEHRLSDEFSRLADYLALMQIRMADRLRVQIDLPPALAGCRLPPLLLQPLVENAIKHGLEPQRRGGLLRISATADDTGRVLRLCVADSGVGWGRDGETPARSGTGFGLSQVRERLANLYGESAALVMQAGPDGGTLACVQLPLTQDLSEASQADPPQGSVAAPMDGPLPSRQP